MGEGIILSFSFCGQLANYYSHVFSLIHPLDEFSFQEMRTWVQSKFSYCYLSVWCKSRELGGRGSPKFPTPMMEIFAYFLSAIKCHWPESHLELYILLLLNLWVGWEHLTSLLSWLTA